MFQVMGRLATVKCQVFYEAQTFESWDTIQYLDKFHKNRFNPGTFGQSFDPFKWVTTVCQGLGWSSNDCLAEQVDLMIRLASKNTKVSSIQRDAVGLLKKFAVFHAVGVHYRTL